MTHRSTNLIALGFCALAIAGCADLKAQIAADAKEVQVASQRPIVDLYYEAQGRPFDNGSISIVADDDGQLRLMQVYPCGGSTACLNGPRGRRLSVSQGLEYTVIRGIEPGHDYYLSPGGDGFINAHGRRQTSLAWE